MKRATLTSLGVIAGLVLQLPVVHAADNMPTFSPLNQAPAASAVAPGKPAGPTSSEPSVDDVKRLVDESGCPLIYVVGVQGTGQSSIDTPTDMDSGFLGGVVGAAKSKADGDEKTRGLIDRMYLPYHAAFGGALGEEAMPYAESVTDGETRLGDALKDISGKCPDTKVFLTGYSQGAHVVSQVAAAVGKGKGAITADKVAGVALFGNPARAEGAEIIPGGSVNAPSPVPGTKGDAVKDLPPITMEKTSGGGSAPEADLVSSYGKLGGRVVDFCVAGDLTCDLPPNTPLAHAVTNIAGQAKLSAGDPIGSLTSIADALAWTSYKTATDVLSEDVKHSSRSAVSYQPKKSIAKRISHASDPRTEKKKPIDVLASAGSIFGSIVKTVVKEVISPETIAAVATAGLVRPEAGLAELGRRFIDAAIKVVAPEGATGTTKKVFQTVTREIEDNEGLIDLATNVKYWQHQKNHSSYGQVPVANTVTATEYATRWILATAIDQAPVPVKNQSKKTTPASSSSAVTTAATTAASSPASAGSAGSGDGVPTFSPLNTPGEER